ncbi:uncharacterized protein ACA1_031150 [Acanthamoeba castellanii str. Neff]|uniref:Uncharacterized protein n=1 Tax=Acanthamoeba castellanii (strain ATCC 30010 / Neff) TaxID=1257118 RepID=L8GHK8_ACACF|nr:uncharacterized protein ACA1_031150 [Acanthamoeba castellanii str. Neff]ELR12233.1 hypothetical protein ACA1_031150 [Acanthamoeba castellanii str. Neff]
MEGCDVVGLLLLFPIHFSIRRANRSSMLLDLEHGRKEVLNTVKFNSKTSNEDTEFASLNLVNKVMLHLGCAQSQLATTISIWRKESCMPFNHMTYPTT